MTQQMDVNFNSVINRLTQQIAQLSYDNAVLQSLVEDYQKKEKENKEDEI